MGISIGNLNAFMPYPVGNGNRRKTHVNQQADVAVPLRYNNDKQKKPLFQGV